MIFAVFDVSLLTVFLNCSFLLIFLSYKQHCVDYNQNLDGNDS